jgi:pimeloyl-ACP methyl ester carboxylesterase
MSPAARRRWRIACAWLALLAGLYGAAMVWLWATQESRIFFPRTMQAARAAQVLQQMPGAREVWLDAPDGTRLHAWWRPAAPAAPSGRALLYFGGNAEDVHWRLGAAAFAGRDLLLTDYRGYGRSSGKPGQAAMQADALLWYDHLAKGVAGQPAPTSIAVMGTSLGSYFATHVAANRPASAVVLVTPFDSVGDYIQSLMPLVPVNLLLRHRLDSRSQAGAVRARTLFIVAQQDTTIPPQRARILWDSWGGQPRQWVEVPDSNHDTVSSDPRYRDALAAFLRELP